MRVFHTTVMATLHIVLVWEILILANVNEGVTLQFILFPLKAVSLELSLSF